MANRNLNQDQFNPEGPHAAMSAVESWHGVDVNPTGINHNGVPIPMSNMFLNDDDAGNGTFLMGRIPHEDPDRVDGIQLYSGLGPPSYGTGDGSISAKGKRGSVYVMEDHSYPVEGGDDSSGHGKVNRHIRNSTHPDLDSALAHINASGDARNDHLANNTLPATEDGSHMLENQYRPYHESLVPPTTFDYRNYAKSGSLDVHKIDTGTRQRLPDKDQ